MYIIIEYIVWNNNMNDSDGGGFIVKCRLGIVSNFLYNGTEIRGIR